MLGVVRSGWSLERGVEGRLTGWAVELDGVFYAFRCHSGVWSVFGWWTVGIGDVCGSPVAFLLSGRMLERGWIRLAAL